MTVKAKLFFVPIFAALCLTAFPQESAKVISSVDPVFPAAVKELDYGETLRVSVNVDKKGRVTEAYVYGPMTPCNDLKDPVAAEVRKAADEAARKTVFEPLMEGGKPVEATLLLSYRLRPKPPTGEPLDAKLVSVGSLTGKALRLERPWYSPKAKALRVGGAIGIEVLVGEDGSVIAAGAVSGHPYLIEGNLAPACKSKFAPVVLSGKPVKFRGVITYNFVP